MKEKNQKGIKSVLWIVAVVLLVAGIYMMTKPKTVEQVPEEPNFEEQASNETTNKNEKILFVHRQGDCLFEVEGYGKLVIDVVRRDDGTDQGPLAFSLAKSKVYPEKDVDYSVVMDKNQFTCDLGNDKTISSDKVSKIDRAIYAFNFVYEDKLTNYGLAEDDTMSLYNAAQLAIWSIAEEWSVNDVIKSEGTISNDELNALADKIHALYTDIYDYAIDASNKTFKSGAVLVNMTEDVLIEKDETIKLTNQPKYRSAEGDIYYRSPLMSLISDQEAGLIWDGDYAYCYKVDLENAPEGVRVVNENGNPQTEFSTKPGVGSNFYIEIPEAISDEEMITVNISTLTFYRSDTVLWNPNSSANYTSLLQICGIPDSETITIHLDYSELK